MSDDKSKVIDYKSDPPKSVAQDGGTHLKMEVTSGRVLIANIWWQLPI